MSFGAKAAKVGAADQVRLDGEGVVDGGMGGEEALGGRLTFEALHPSFSSPDWEVRVLGPIVFAKPSRPMKLLQIQQTQGCRVRS